MFRRSGMLMLGLAVTAVALSAGSAVAGLAADPTRAQLQRMLLTSQDLAAVTKLSWKAQPVEVRVPAGPAGTADSSGCPDLDNAVLANNTGLVDSGIIAFDTPAGDHLEQTVAYDRNALADVRQLARAIEQCPKMVFSDGPPIVVKPIALGERVAGFRAYVGGRSSSVVLVAAHHDYVIELIASDRGQPDSYYEALLEKAYERVDNPI